MCKQITNRSTGAGELAAWLSVVYENCRASATVSNGNRPIAEIGPVDCRSINGIWDFVLRLLRVLFPEFSHRDRLGQTSGSRVRIDWYRRPKALLGRP
ncbi:hypothetical protein DO72_859 [Burkholderia pseudomallei]|nr:hypothetical protein DO72_859 [Burkholderia pseudomallei]